jgi:hypothetical protein
MPPVIARRCNRQVSCSSSPSNDRSESAIVANPNDPYHLIGSSKKFTDPHTYAFSLVAYCSFDGGQSWTEAPPLVLLNTGDVDDAGVMWTGDPVVGVSDPAVAFDDLGNAYLAGLMFGVPSMADPYHFLGMSVYKSTDGGRTWSLPRVIHSGLDDKQWLAGDANPASPNHGNIYCAWDNLGTNGGLSFSRSTDHGVTWTGAGTAASGAVVSTELSFAEINVDSSGNVYIFGFGINNNQNAIKFIKSTDGGQTFSAAQVAATGITMPPDQLPGGIFRVELLPTACCGAGNHVVCAWPDYRDGVARIYYARSNNGGNSWQSAASGDPLLVGSVASASDQHDFMPQIVAMPTGEIGCAFYELGPKSGSTNSLIDVVLAVSTDNGHTFPNRITATDQPWDPTVDEVWAHGSSTLTFIGDYFGLDASRLGFFPFWTDTRTMVQEIFTSRIALNPADVYIRDSSSDTGSVPSPGNHWEAPDLVVRWQQDGATTFVDQGIQSPLLNDHYIYARVTNAGPNPAVNVTVAVTVANWPQLAGLPGTEFSYPQDWYQGNWATSGLQANRRFLGETPAIASLASGATQIVGPIVWQMADIPDQSWHPCLLADARADNNDSAGGTDGCAIDSDPDPCTFGSYFWGNNNACQRNLTFNQAPLPARIVFPFIVGSVWNKARYLEVLIDKGPHLAKIPMQLHAEPIELPGHPHAGCTSELLFLSRGHVAVRAGERTLGELVLPPGAVWRCPDGASHQVGPWHLTRGRRESVGFSSAPGRLWKLTLAFDRPEKLPPGTSVRVFQRNDKHVITGSVELALTRGHARD